MKKYLFILVAFVATAVASTITAYAQTPVVITGRGVRVRCAPSLNAQMLNKPGTNKPAYVNKGETYTCYGHQNGFCNINYRGYNAWVASEYCNHNYHYQDNSSYVTVHGKGVRLRYAPSLNSAVCTQVSTGTSLQCLGQSNGFWQVKYRGNVLWVSKQYAW